MLPNIELISGCRCVLTLDAKSTYIDNILNVVFQIVLDYKIYNISITIQQNIFVLNDNK